MREECALEHDVTAFIKGSLELLLRHLSIRSCDTAMLGALARTADVQSSFLIPHLPKRSSCLAACGT